MINGGKERSLFFGMLEMILFVWRFGFIYFIYGFFRVLSLGRILSKRMGWVV